MGNLYKPKYTKMDPKTGQRVTRKVRKWYGKYRDDNGKLQCVPLCEDKTAAAAMLTEIIRRSRLQQVGLLDAAADHLAAPIEGHLNDFKSHLDAKARSEKHIRETLRVIGNVVSRCRVKILADLQDAGDLLEKHLAERRRAGASHRTINGDLVAIRSFCKWLIRRKRMHDDPTDGLVRLNEDEDPRMERRALSAEEAERLIQTTCDSKRVVRRLTGRDRAVLYLLAQNTGLRRGELRKLTTDAFDFSAYTPTVSVRASHSKGRRHHTLPLASGVAEVMKEYLAKRLAKDLVWPGSWWRQSAKMLQRDLADAGIPVVDKEGRVVDFHGQRTSFITGLARAGVIPAVAQKLARHRDINLTLNTYTHLQMDELACAVEKLPRVASAMNAHAKGDTADSTGAASELDEGAMCVVAAWPLLTEEVRTAILNLVVQHTARTHPAGKHERTG